MSLTIGTTTATSIVEGSANTTVGEGDKTLSGGGYIVEVSASTTVGEGATVATAAGGNHVSVDMASFSEDASLYRKCFINCTSGWSHCSSDPSHYHHTPNTTQVTVLYTLDS